MLVSHRKRFIFTKTAKTAATSIELYFEPYCLPDGSRSLSHARDEYAGETGIVGYRGPNRIGKTWFNHMSASRIRRLVGADVWNSYYKFCVIRNPFDRLVSAFHHKERLRNKPLDLKNLRNKILLLRFRPQGTNDIDRFRDWMATGGDLRDRDKYVIAGKICMDHFIRFEAIHEGVERVCQALDLPFEPERLPRLKTELRTDSIAFVEYYDRKTRDMVRKLYAFEIEKFGYDLCLD